jgi:dTDP-4-amino-4,6-dideoxygalactose transaminase
MVDELLRSTGLSGTAHRDALESALAQATARYHAVSLASSEQALSLLLHAVGVTQDREVVVPALGDTAILRAIRRVGGIPKFADCDPGTLVPTAASVEQCITDETAAVAASHGDGWGTGLPAVAAICARNEVPLVELVGTRVGSSCGAAPAGSLGRAAYIDLSQRGIISTGEGGAIVTDDEHLAAACRPAPYHSSLCPFRADALSELNAAVGLAQLRRLSTTIEVCTDAAETYTIALSRMPELLLPATTPDAVSCWSRYVIRLDETFSADDRDEIIRGMERHEIQAAAGLSHLPAEWDSSLASTCPVAAATASRTIALPIHPALTRRDVELICQTLQLMVQRATLRRSA